MLRSMANRWQTVGAVWGAHHPCREHHSATAAHQTEVTEISLQALVFFPHISD